eukprot:4923296-Pleurochrysis_carterae.AAC.2
MSSISDSSESWVSSSSSASRVPTAAAERKAPGVGVGSVARTWRGLVASVVVARNAACRSTDAASAARLAGVAKAPARTMADAELAASIAAAAAGATLAASASAKELRAELDA